MSSEEQEGTIPTSTQQLKEFADNITETSLERLSLEGQLKQALISLERYIDSDQTIPKYALSQAKGIVFLSLVKCGFMVEGCIGIGCIMVQYNDLKNKWSSPSSIICGGLSIGLLAGATKIDYIIILPNKDAVTSFMSSGQFRIGTDLSLSVGSIGRHINGEIGIGEIGPISVVYSYSHSKGLYGGISLHGKIIKVLHKCNQTFYGFKVNNQQILSGNIQMPTEYKSNHYNKIVFILQSYCFKDNISNTCNINNKCVKECVKECECKLCQLQKKTKLEFDNTNPFHNNIKTPMKQNKICINKTKIRNKTMTVNQLQIKPKFHQKTVKTIILKETFLEATPPPIIIDDNKKEEIKNEEIKKEKINVDPYALSVRPWDSVIEQNIETKLDEKIDININEKEEEKDINKKKEHKKYVKPSSNINDKHYSDYEISSYSLDKYDENGYRINCFKLLFQIDDISYQTEIQIAGKLVSKQYIVDWPKKRDCKAVIIVTSKIYSSYIDIDPYNDNNNNYELRLICYDERDDDLIIYNININFKNISQIVNTINGSFILSPNKPWIVLESIFIQYKQKMYESMIDISKNYNEENILKYGDLIRANFGSLCQYGIYIGHDEVICFRRRFPNNGSSAFKKYRLLLLVFNGKASKKIRMKYMTLNEFIFDCSRIEVIYYPLPSISPITMAKKALFAANNQIKNCIFEYSPIIQSKRTLTTKEIIEDSVLSVIDGITSTVNTIESLVSPVTK